MNEIISRWLQSGLLPEAAVLTAVGLLLLLYLLKREKERKSVLLQSEPKDPEGDSPTEELPVAEIRAATSSFQILEDIVFCESEFIIS